LKREFLKHTTKMRGLTVHLTDINESFHTVNNINNVLYKKLQYLKAMANGGMAANRIYVYVNLYNTRTCKREHA
jgi:hypothetical protein